MVAACAALTWLVKPSLTNQQVWDKLVGDGVASTGFGYSVPRVDLFQTLKDVGGLTLSAPGAPQLVCSGTVNLTPVVTGSADKVEAYLNGTLVQTVTSAPWDFSIDTSGTSFGTADVQFIAYSGATTKTADVVIAIDNTGGQFPLLDSFDSGAPNFIGYDAKYLAQTPLDNLYNLPGGDKSTDTFLSAGTGSWRQTTLNPFKGSGDEACITDSGSYGPYEIDALISRKIKVPASNGSLVFYHHYNIENGGSGLDRGYVLVTADGGQTFTTATLKTGGPAYFTGLQASWWKGEVNLAPFAGQTVNLVFCLQTDEQTSGEDTGQPAGWWLDAVTVATNYNESIPLISGVNVNSYSLYGAVPAKPQIDVQVEQPTNVAKVKYILDCAPAGSGPEDVTVTVNGNAPWAGQIDLPAVKNQLATLHVQYFDASNIAGPQVDVPVYIFNHPGDVNADGAVNQADLDAFPAALGLKSGDAGFVPFFDTDLDGKVTEADASAVGYNWDS